MFNKFGKIFIVTVLSVVFVLPLSVQAGRAEGGDLNFSVQPTTLNANREQSVTLNFTAGIMIYGQEFRNYCGVNVGRATWSVRQITSGNTPSYSNSVSLATQTINVNTNEVPILRQYTASATVRGSSANEVRRIFANLECGSGGADWGPGGSKLITQSSIVELTVNSSGGTAATPAPGSSRSFDFSIPNPLRGGASTLEDLVVVLAEWIFKLAIPIAVVMIVYSGVLFLTAQGNTSTIQKARDVLKWAVVGLAIILIGSGFITLIQSVLELGSTGNSGGLNPSSSAVPSTSTSPGGLALGQSCSRDRDCATGLKCDGICQRQNGNNLNEACAGGRNCSTGLICDSTGTNRKVIDGTVLGSCVAP